MNLSAAGLARRRLAVAAMLLWTCGPCRGLEPASSIRVDVSSAGVTGLDCRRREFKMEYTKVIGRRYRSMSGGMFTRDPDPRVLAMGAFAMVLMAPLAVLAVPADLLAAPLRRECDFELHAQGTLVGWAGRRPAQESILAYGRSLVSPGIEEEGGPVYRITGSSATADADGRFSIAVAGRVGRSRDFEVRWAVNSLPAGTMVLRKRGGVFILSEPEAEFGASLDTIEPLVIRPQKKGPP